MAQSVSASAAEPFSAPGVSPALHERIAARIASGAVDLPMLPQVASEILAQGGAENTDVRRLADLLHRDQALAGHVLRVANSAAFAGDVRIQSIQQALIRIGLVQMREIVVGVALHGKVFRGDSHKELLASLWTHSTVAGLYAKEIARHLRANVETAFVCGLLHDVGKPVVLGIVLDLCQETREVVAPDACAAALDAFHTRVGRLLAERWDLPEPVLESIARHHDVETTVALGTTVQVTALADLLAYVAVEPDEAQDEQRSRLDGHPLSAALNLYPDDVAALFAKRAAVLEQAKAFAS
jgi:putative nucleotidyltransferase with HDIG domain